MRDDERHSKALILLATVLERIIAALESDYDVAADVSRDDLTEARRQALIVLDRRGKKEDTP